MQFEITILIFNKLILNRDFSALVILTIPSGFCGSEKSFSGGRLCYLKIIVFFVSSKVAILQR